MKTSTTTWKGKEILTRDFKSFDEMLTYAKKPLPMEVEEKYSNQSVVEVANEYFNGATYEDGMRNASLGWSKGWEIAQKTSTQFRIDLADTTLRKDTVQSYHGQSVNMSRFLMGDPRCMRYSKRKQLKKRGRIVKLFVHSGMLANVNHDQIINRGASILALVNALEGTGYRVEIEAGFLAMGTGSASNYSDYRFKLKDAEETLDQDKLGFALVSPSMHRIVGFRVREQESNEWHEGYNTFGGQGSTTDYTNRKVMGGLKPTESDVYCGVNENDWSVFDSESGAKEWLQEQFDIFGIKTEGV
jgi:hypothetical protein